MAVFLTYAWLLAHPPRVVGPPGVVRVGMDEAQVRQIKGQPRSVEEAGGGRGSTVELWNYDHLQIMFVYGGVRAIRSLKR